MAVLAVFLIQFNVNMGINVDCVYEIIEPRQWLLACWLIGEGLPTNLVHIVTTSSSYLHASDPLLRLHSPGRFYYFCRLITSFSATAVASQTFYVVAVLQVGLGLIVCFARHVCTQYYGV